VVGGLFDGTALYRNLLNYSILVFCIVCNQDATRYRQNILEPQCLCILRYKNWALRQPNRIMRDIVQSKNTDLRRHDKPIATEVALIFQTNKNGEPLLERDVRVYPREAMFYCLCILDRNLDPVMDPLFFPKESSAGMKNIKSW